MRSLYTYISIVFILLFAFATPSVADAKNKFTVVIDPGHGGGDESKEDTGLGAHYDLIGKNEKETNIFIASQDKVVGNILGEKQLSIF